MATRRSKRNQGNAGCDDNDGKGETKRKRDSSNSNMPVTAIASKKQKKKKKKAAASTANTKPTTTQPPITSTKGKVAIPVYDHDYHKKNDWVQCDDCNEWHQHPREFRGKFGSEWSCWMMEWDPLDESIARCVKATTINSKQNDTDSVLHDCSNLNRADRKRAPTPKKQALIESQKTKSSVQMNKKQSLTKKLIFGKRDNDVNDIAIDIATTMLTMKKNAPTPIVTNIVENENSNGELGLAPSSIKDYLTPKQTPKSRQNTLTKIGSIDSVINKIKNKQPVSLVDNNNRTEKENTIDFNKEGEDNDNILTDGKDSGNEQEEDAAAKKIKLKEQEEATTKKKQQAEAAKQQQEEAAKQQQEEAAKKLKIKQQEEKSAVVATTAKKDKEDESAAAKKDEEDKAAAAATITKKKQQEQQYAIAVEQEQRELEVEAAAALQKQKEARAAALQTEREAREAMLRDDAETEAAALQQKQQDEEEASAVASEVLAEKEKEKEKEHNPTDKDKDNNEVKLESKVTSKTTSIRGEAFGQFDVPELIDHIPNEIKVEVLSKMYNMLIHPCWKYHQLRKPILDPDDVLLPLRSTLICVDDYKSLSRDPVTTSDTSLLFGGYAIHNLATQIMFPTEDGSNWWCALPANTFELMCGGKYEISNYFHQHLNNNRHIGDNLLNFSVVSILIWHGMHFSKAFVCYANNVVNGDYKYGDNKGPHSCILYTNSSGNTSWHNPKKVAEKIRTFLNAYSIAFLKTTKKGQFNCISMPVYQIKVPQQEDSWTCLYHTILLEHKVMEALSALKHIRKDDVTGILRDADDEDIPEEEVIPFEQRFIYDPSDAITARKDLQCVVVCLKMIHRTSGDVFARRPIPASAEIIGIDDDSNIDSDKPEPVVPITRPKQKSASKKSKKKRESIADKREQGRTALDRVRLKEQKRRLEVQKDRLALHQSILDSSIHPAVENAKKKAARTVDRRLGEGAASLESFHDDAYRRALHHVGRRSLDFSLMNEFVNPIANRTMNPAMYFGVFFNPIAEYPDRKGKDFMQYREKEQYVIITPHKKEALQKHIAYLHNNFNNMNIITADNCIDLDVNVMGLDRPDLGNFIQRKSTKKEVKNRDNNQEILKKTTAVKPYKENKIDYSDNKEEDLGEHFLEDLLRSPSP